MPGGHCEPARMWSHAKVRACSPLSNSEGNWGWGRFSGFRDFSGSMIHSWSPKPKQKGEI